ncbi:alpha/beta hydrolase [Actinacidiphila glaucinigra]|uniref:alpha/beta fold hydrolase n=1 Tax=Actinacidiphila glaucinigra TaxID=235986 RepID=UPI0033B1D2FA
MIDRRTFGVIVGRGAVAATLTGVAAGCAMAGSEESKPAPPGARGKERPGDAAAFGPLKQVEAGVLDVGYVELGPADGPAVILLHGWPYDIHSYVAVAPLLAAKGYRVVVPYLRGYGTTRFLSRSTPRDGEQAAFAQDIIALMDALGIKKAILAGFDWGGRAAVIVAALWPERVTALVSVGGYLVTNRKTAQQPLPPKTEQAWWYQYYFATDRGRRGLDRYRHDLTKLVWTTNSPTWGFDDATFVRTAEAFDNPDFVPLTIDNYRWRLSLAEGDPRYADIEARLARGPVVTVPTITLDGAVDPFTPPGNGSSYRDKFTGKYAHRTLQGIGHNVPQEAPAAFAQAVIDVGRL